ncbi:hypothetical protein [Methylorubrum populi]|uniref:Uncharacterized protein n=1 Tax=Methylorubrum populi TaxID=223967 RepID=A0A833N4D0_9HYPH|nr:hypothetical protein [Methylorubrum populi]KAB7788084.1 hypothetical protein F8B43_0089 [Methylorubrum populi]
MNVYAVLLVMGQTVASIGPWPTDLAGCLKHVPESNANIDAAFKDPTKLAALRKAYPGLEHDHVSWTCIESATKPAIKNGVPLP